MINMKITGLPGFAERLKDHTVELLKSKTVERIEAIRCPVHGTTGKATVTEEPKGHFNFGVTGCCEKLVEEVQKSVKPTGL